MAKESGPYRSGHAPAGELPTGNPSGVFRPPVEILESDDEVLIRVSVPGVGPDDVHVFAAEDEVEVEGVIRRTETGRVACDELNYGAFRRCVRLPFLVEPDQGQVILHGGVLRIALPRLKYHA